MRRTNELPNLVIDRKPIQEDHVVVPVHSRKKSLGVLPSATSQSNETMLGTPGDPSSETPSTARTCTPQSNSSQMYSRRKTFDRNPSPFKPRYSFLNNEPLLYAKIKSSPDVLDGILKPSGNTSKSSEDIAAESVKKAHIGDDLAKHNKMSSIKKLTKSISGLFSTEKSSTINLSSQSRSNSEKNLYYCSQDSSGSSQTIPSTIESTSKPSDKRELQLGNNITDNNTGNVDEGCKSLKKLFGLSKTLVNSGSSINLTTPNGTGGHIRNISKPNLNIEDGHTRSSTKSSLYIEAGPPAFNSVEGTPKAKRTDANSKKWYEKVHNALKGTPKPPSEQQVKKS